MSRSFTIPYDPSRISKMVAESGSYIATVPSGPSSALIGTVEIGGVRYMASIPTDAYMVEKFYPIVEQQNCIMSLKNALVPFILVVGNKE